MALPGIRFEHSNGKFSDKPEFYLFPTTEEEFFKVYKNYTFGEPMSDADLADKFKKLKGKVYIKVTFMTNTTDGENQVQIVPLKSKTRSLTEVRKLVQKVPQVGTSPKSIRSWILDLGGVKNSPERNKVFAHKNSLISGSQVLDMLLSLALNQPGLFKQLAETQEEEFVEIRKQLEANANPAFKTFLDVYFEELKDKVKTLQGDSIIARISYGNSELMDVYQLILKLVKENDAEPGKYESVAKMKDKLVRDIKGLNKTT
jgi:hypothetical protein